MSGFEKLTTASRLKCGTYVFVRAAALSPIGGNQSKISLSQPLLSKWKLVAYLGYCADEDTRLWKATPVGSLSLGVALSRCVCVCVCVCVWWWWWWCVADFLSPPLTISVFLRLLTTEIPDIARINYLCLY